MKMPKIKNTKQKIYVVLGATVVVVLGLGFFVLWPFQEKIIISQANIQNNRQEIEEMQQRQEALIYSGRSYSELQQNGASKIHNIFVSRDGVLEFVNELETLATQNNVSQNINLNEASIEEGEEALIMTLTLGGDYLELVNYMQKLEQENFYFDWQEITFKQAISREGEESVALNATIKTKVYWLE